jgi:hypothetical protein
MKVSSVNTEVVSVVGFIELHFRISDFRFRISVFRDFLNIEVFPCYF